MAKKPPTMTIKYKPPAILAKRRGDAPTIRSVLAPVLISAVLIVVSPAD
jgi:hypothetical protein